MKRKISWLLAAVAYLGPPTWAFFAIKADREYQMAGHGWICGTPMISIMLLAGALSAVASLVATGLGIASFRTLPKPRPMARVFELVGLALPSVMAISLVLLLIP